MLSFFSASSNDNLEIESVELDSKYPISARWYYFLNIIKHDNRINKLETLKEKQQELLDYYFKESSKDKNFYNKTLKCITSKYAEEIQLLLEELKDSYYPYFDRIKNNND